MMTDPEQRQLHTAVNEALWRTTVCGPTLTCLEATSLPSKPQMPVSLHRSAVADCTLKKIKAEFTPEVVSLLMFAS